MLNQTNLHQKTRIDGGQDAQINNPEQRAKIKNILVINSRYNTRFDRSVIPRVYCKIS
jgi:hypothetical protein